MGLRVLVVEDDADIRQLLHEILRLYGLQAIGIGHPDSVVDVARHENPDLFLIDVMLPKMSGIELAEKLRGNGFERTPMIAISASSIMRDLAIHTGVFDATLGKPFDIDDLLQCIQDAVMGASRQRVQTPALDTIDISRR